MNRTSYSPSGVLVETELEARCRGRALVVSWNTENLRPSELLPGVLKDPRTNSIWVEGYDPPQSR